MYLKNQTVTHKSLGQGKIIRHDEKYVTVLFATGEQLFQYPAAFDRFLTLDDPDVAQQIKDNLKQLADKKQQPPEAEAPPPTPQQPIAETPKPTRRRASGRENIAFKCNFCDGGKTDIHVGFNGVCSPEQIHRNVVKDPRPGCSDPNSCCLKYCNDEMTYEELEALYNSGSILCYESKMLSDWRAHAGYHRTGKDSGKPVNLKCAQENSLCILTTRDPKTKERDRFVFAVYLLDDAERSDELAEGCISTQSKYKLSLTPSEAKRLLFWLYYSNPSASATLRWDSGQYRTFPDEPAAQLLRDIVKIKSGTPDEPLATEFYNYYCSANGIDIETLGEPAGALTLH